jgi:SAM-dependent methyltransferase
MNPQEPSDIRTAGEDYDQKAEEYNWRGPEIAFGLSYGFIKPGESVLDIGIGTGLGSALFHKAGLRVFGMDRSAQMLEICRLKGLPTDLRHHDLTVEPYPYDAASLDHAVCIGVLDFFRDLRPVFRQLARILRDHGVFVFIMGTRGPEEAPEYTAQSESGSSVTMYRRSAGEINQLSEAHSFEPLRHVEFFVLRHLGSREPLLLTAYLTRRMGRL